MAPLVQITKRSASISTNPIPVTSLTFMITPPETITACSPFAKGSIRILNPDDPRGETLYWRAGVSIPEDVIGIGIPPGIPIGGVTGTVLGRGFCKTGAGLTGANPGLF